MDLLQRQSQLKQDLERIEEEWLGLHEDLELLEAAS